MVPISYGGMPYSTLMQGEGLVVPQLNKPDYIDFPLEHLPIGRSGWGLSMDGGGVGVGMGRIEPWMEYRIKLKNK